MLSARRLTVHVARQLLRGHEHPLISSPASGFHTRHPGSARGAFTSSGLVRAAAVDEAEFVGITPGRSKLETIAAKNKNIDTAGIWPELPPWVQESLKDPLKSKFVDWLGHGVTRGKAAIVQLFTPEEADAIIERMGTDSTRVGVMDSSQIAELYVGRLSTARHLIADKALAECIHQRFTHCCVQGRTSANGVDGVPLLSLMQFGSEVVGVGEKIRLVTTEEGGEHEKHADISEPSDDGIRVSRLTFQCYLNPEAYEGGHFQLYPQKSGGNTPVDVPIGKGCAVVFVQEDAELLHGGGRKGAGSAKRAIRGNLEVNVGP